MNFDKIGTINFEAFGESLISAILVFIFIYATKIIMDLIVKSKYNANIEIEENNNMGIAFRRFGMYIGMGIAMYSSVNSYLIQIMDGFLILIFMMIAVQIGDKITIPGVNNTNELKKGNVAVGIAEAGLFIATGIIAFGSFSGEGPWYSSIVFFLLSQIVLIIMARVFELIHGDVVPAIKEGNTAAGLLLGGSMIAYALILKTAVAGNFISWEVDLISFGISVISGFILILLFANKVIDRLFLPGTTIKKEIEDRNVSAILVVVAMKFVVAFIISAVMF